MSDDSMESECCPDLKPFKRGTTDNTSVTPEWERRANAAIDARCGKPTADLPPAPKGGRNPWDK